LTLASGLICNIYILEKKNSLIKSNLLLKACRFTQHTFLFA